MNLRQRILSGHLLLTGLLVALSVYGIHRQRGAASVRKQALDSGKDQVYVDLLNRQVDEYFKLRRLLEETPDPEIEQAAERALEEARPLYRRLRSGLEATPTRKPSNYLELDRLFGWPEERMVPSAAKVA